MPHKSCFSLDIKKQAVEDCLAGRMSINGCATMRGIPFSTLRDWIRLYETRGIQGLIPAARIRKYSETTKYMAVEEYLKGEISLASVCKKYDINGTHSLRQWIKLYNNCEILKQRNSGGAKYMPKGRNTTE